MTLSHCPSSGSPNAGAKTRVCAHTHRDTHFSFGSMYHFISPSFLALWCIALFHAMFSFCCSGGCEWRLARGRGTPVWSCCVDLLSSCPPGPMPLCPVASAWPRFPRRVSSEGRGATGEGHTSPSHDGLKKQLSDAVQTS